MSNMRNSKRFALGAALVLLASAWAFCFDRVGDETRALAKLLQVSAGDAVADVGAGDGEFAVELAQIVGADGRVIATEVDPVKIEKLQRLARGQPLENLEVVEGDQFRTGLSSGCCDAVLLRLVYHHFEDPEKMQDDLFQALRPGGRIVVIDFPPDNHLPRRSVPKFREGHGVTAAVIVREMSAAGFRLLQRKEHWQGDGDHYLLLFEKPARSASLR